MIPELIEIVKQYQNELYAGFFGVSTGVGEALRAWDTPNENKYVPEAIAFCGAVVVAFKSVEGGHSDLHAAADIGIVVSTYLLSRVACAALIAGRRHPTHPDAPRE